MAAEGLRLNHAVTIELRNASPGAISIPDWRRLRELAHDIQDEILRTRLDVSRVPEWLYRRTETGTNSTSLIPPKTTAGAYLHNPESNDERIRTDAQPRASPIGGIPSTSTKMTAMPTWSMRPTGLLAPDRGDARRKNAANTGSAGAERDRAAGVDRCAARSSATARYSAARWSGHQDAPLPGTGSAETAVSNIPSNVTLETGRTGFVESQLRTTGRGPADDFFHDLGGAAETLKNS